VYTLHFEPHNEFTKQFDIQRRINRLQAHDVWNYGTEKIFLLKFTVTAWMNWETQFNWSFGMWSFSCYFTFLLNAALKRSCQIQLSYSPLRY